MPKRSNILGISLALAGCAMLTAQDALADWVGDSVGLQYFFPIPEVLLDDLAPQTVPGAVFDLANEVPAGGTNTITVTSNQILVDLNPGVADNFTGAEFNGWVLTDLTQDPGISNVVLSSTSNFALTQADISSTRNSITVNWQGLIFGVDADGNPARSTAVLDIAFGAPEPATFVLLGLALAGIGLATRRKPSYRILHHQPCR